MNRLIKDDHLSHHGIKGQKWGVRNGPPYPLGASDHSASEKKAGWRKSLDRKGIATDNKKMVKMGRDAGIGMSDDMAELLWNIPAMMIPVVVPALVAKGAFAVEYHMRRHKEKSVNQNITSSRDIPRKKTPCSADEDMAATNPNYKKDKQGNYGYTRNCMYCATVYDLRRRGYDVTANKRDEGGLTKEVTEWYRGAKIEKYRNSDKALNALRHQPDGARGNLIGTGPFGGHSVAYEVHNGKVEIIDGQSNERWTWDKFTTQFPKGLEIIRTDNCEPNWEKIREVIDPDSLRRKE